jgi:predicted nucleotidyltransferase component of viral defense system
MLQQKFVDWFARDSNVSLPVAERDVVLTYVLRVLADVGLLERLIFKGGTCIRKVFLGRSGRFSEDLDFTAVGISDPDDLILAIAEAFDGRSYHGITYSVKTSDFYVREDRQACGARVGYSHEWNPSAQFALDVSLREEPVLGVQTLPLLSDSYFKHLEIEPPVVTMLHFEEIVAEKIRATYQRLTVRDVYDLYLFRQMPFDRDLVRTLAVLKLWLADDTFDPSRFFTNLESERYDWSDLGRLVRRDRRPETRMVITGCLEGYGFLRNLSADEAELTGDPHRRRRDLYERIVQRLRS